MKHKFLASGPRAKVLGLCALLGTAAVLEFGRDIHGAAWILFIIFGAIVVQFFRVSAHKALREHQIPLQLQRDKFPLEEVEFLRGFNLSVPKRDFRLFLRSFDSISTFTLKNPAYKETWIADSQPKELEFEYVLAKYLEEGPPGKVFAIGGRPLAVGPGHLNVSDEEWQDCFDLMARAATSVLVIPGRSEGSLWELGWLKANFFLDKTIFIMPCEKASAHQPGAPAWHRTAEEVEKLGLEVPAYEKAGLLYKLDSLGRLYKSLPLNADSPSKMIAAVIELEAPY